MTEQEIEKEAFDLMDEWMDFPVSPGAPIDYMFGLWLEGHFNREKQMKIPYSNLHKIATFYCKQQCLM